MNFLNETENAAFNHLKKAVAKYIGTVTIDKNFINYRNKCVIDHQNADRKNNRIFRDLEQYQKDADCVLLEYHLIINQIVQATSEWQSDFELFGLKIDAKNIHTKWFSVSDHKLLQYQTSANSSKLTHFMFWKYNYIPNRPFEEGDTTSFKILELRNAKEVLSNLKSSNYGGYYYGVDAYEQAA